jgi:hypothetical protein
MSEEIVDAPVDTENTVDAPVEVEAPIEGAEALGDPGKRALDTMKAERKAATDRAKAAEAERDALKAQLEGREAEHAAAQEKQRARDEALAVANKRILSAELRAAAKGKLADPSDAALYINLDEFEVSEDGEVDSDALASAIDDLLARKSHLAADSRRFDGAADQGAKGEHRQSQLSATDLETMSAAEINQARRDGRLNKVLGINS